MDAELIHALLATRTHMHASVDTDTRIRYLTAKRFPSVITISRKISDGGRSIVHSDILYATVRHARRSTITSNDPDSSVDLVDYV